MGAPPRQPSSRAAAVVAAGPSGALRAGLQSCPHPNSFLFFPLSAFPFFPAFHVNEKKVRMQRTQGKLSLILLFQKGMLIPSFFPWHLFMFPAVSFLLSYFLHHCGYALLANISFPQHNLPVDTGRIEAVGPLATSLPVFSLAAAVLSPASASGSLLLQLASESFGSGISSAIHQLGIT